MTRRGWAHLARLGRTPMLQLALGFLLLSAVSLSGVAAAEGARQLTVGVFEGGEVVGQVGIKAVIASMPGYTMCTVRRPDLAELGACDVVVIPDCHRFQFRRGEGRLWKEHLSAYVRECGGSLVLYHDSVGFRSPLGEKMLFPEIVADAPTKSDLSEIVIAEDDPLTRGYAAGSTVKHAYSDHVVMTPGPDGRVVARDAQGDAVVVCGRAGEGGIVANGTIMMQPDGAEVTEPSGFDRDLLVNSLAWLADSFALKLAAVAAAQSRLQQMEAQLRKPTDYRVWTANPWSSFAPRLSEGEAQPPERDAEVVEFGLARDAYEAAAIMIANPAPAETLTLRIQVSGFAHRGGETANVSAQCLTVREAVFTLTRAGTPVPDALPHLSEAATITVPPGEVRQLFLTFNSHAIAAGDYEATLSLKPLDDRPAKSLRLLAHVWDFALPERMPITVFTWDYAKWAQQQAAAAYLDDLVEHGVNAFHYSGLPTVTCDRDGNLAAEPDFSGCDATLAALKGKGQVLFETWCFRGADFPTPDGGTVPYLSPPWKKAFASWLERFVAYLESRELTYDDWIFYPFDEYIGPQFVDLAREIKRINPRVRVFSDRMGTLEEIKRIAPYVDVWCPVDGSYQQPENSAALDFMKATGKPVWFYFCGWEQRAWSPYERYRLMGWKAWRWGLQGATYWTLYGWVGDEWDDFDGDYGDAFSVYRGPDGPIPSRRWEAFRAGLQDYCYLWMLDNLVGGIEKAGARPEAVAFAREALAKAPDDVLASAADHSRANRWRERVAKLIVHLQEMPAASKDARR
jgi:hypothetical protein